MALKQIKPADGSRAVIGSQETVLLGQPPEVLKGLLIHNISHFDTLVLCDSQKKDGSLLNNLEFPLYFFLFVAKGIEKGRLLNLVGEAEDISRALRILRLTLLGPTKAELDNWGTEEKLKKEWLGASKKLALKNKKNQVREVESFFNFVPFVDDEAKTSHFTIKYLGHDKYQLSYESEASIKINLQEDSEINSPYLM